MTFAIPSGLSQALKERRVIPFIGAGFSKSFGLPDWSQLLDMVASEMNMEPEICRLYGDFLQIAEYYSLSQRGLGALRNKLDAIFNNKNIDVTSSKSHMLLPRLGAPAIYTTNWDNLIERAFTESKVNFNRIATVEDMINADPRVPSIIKYHGDFSRDESLVFTEASYFERLDLESPLDIRLRSDLLGRTALFIGYSLSDLNVRYLWFKLNKVLQSGLGRKAGPNAYIVMTKPNPVLEAVYTHRGIEAISLDPLDVGGSLFNLFEAMVDAAA